MTADLSVRVKKALRAVPDYPKPGIIFQDITPVMADGGLFGEVIAAMVDPFKERGVTHILGIEARGFIFGAAAAQALGVGFIPARKPGKLPWDRLQESYALEYGNDALEAHSDACPSGTRVLIVDDVLATGGTAQAAGNLISKLGGELVGWSFVIELGFLPGRSRLSGATAQSLVVLN